MKKINMLRQGDVLLVPVANIPTGGNPRKSGILAYGESTGHSHRLAALEAGELYEVGDRLFLSVTAEGGVSIQHQEHAAVQVDKGQYEVRIQREYTPEEIRNVAD
jgi:hypothetical protein